MYSPFVRSIFSGSSLYRVDNFKLSRDEIKCQDQDIGSEKAIPYSLDDMIASRGFSLPSLSTQNGEEPKDL